MMACNYTIKHTATTALDPGLLLNATHFACEAHRDQRRKNKFAAPYINHPVGVAQILWTEGRVRDIDVLQAAILHDTVEDTDTTHEELVFIFGKKVADIVKDVTDDKSMPKDKRKRHQVEHAKHISQQAKVVKLADKLHNLRDLKNCPPSGWDVKRIQGYFVWCQAVVKSVSGANYLLEEALKDLFATGTFLVESKSTTNTTRAPGTLLMEVGTYDKYDCVPKDTDLTEFLETYYSAMSIAGKTEDN